MRVSLSESEIAKRAERLDALCNELSDSLRVATDQIGFLCGIVDNPSVAEKLGGSYIGRVLDTGVRSVISSIVLYVTRSWDENGYSLRDFAVQIDGMATFIEVDRRRECPSWPEAFLEIGRVDPIVQRFRADCEELMLSSSFAYLRIHRDEFLAHSLKGVSGARRKLEREGIVPEAIAYADLLDVAQRTARLAAEAVRIWKFHVTTVDDDIELAADNTREFFRLLPRLADLETAD